MREPRSGRSRAERRRRGGACRELCVIRRIGISATGKTLIAKVDAPGSTICLALGAPTDAGPSLAPTRPPPAPADGVSGSFLPPGTGDGGVGNGLEVLVGAGSTCATGARFCLDEDPPASVLTVSEPHLLVGEAGLAPPNRGEDDDAAGEAVLIWEGEEAGSSLPHRATTLGFFLSPSVGTVVDGAGDEGVEEDSRS